MRVDTAVWNLGLPLALAGGCSPIELIGQEGGDADTSGSTTMVGGTMSTTMGPTDPTLPDPTTSTAPTTIDPSQTDTFVPPCMSAYECMPGYCCIEQICTYFGFCPDGCPQELCCLGMCGSYDCFYDDECGPGAVCEGGACTYIELEPECMLPLQLELQIPLEMVAGDIRALAFIDADGDAQRDVVVGESTGVRLVLGWDQSLVEIASNMEVAGLAVGDVDGDMDQDILVGDRWPDGGALRLFRHDPMVSFVPVPLADLTTVTAIALADSDGDQLVDLLAIDELTGLQWLRGLGGGMFDVPVPVWLGPTAIAVGALDGDAMQDVVAHQTFAFALLGGPGFEATQLVEGGNGTYARALAVGDFDGVPPDDVVALHTSAGTTVATKWQSSVFDWVDHKSWWFGATTVAVRADLDDDGHADVIAAGGEPQLVVAHGAPPQSTSDVIDCVMTVPTMAPVVQLAVGDFTGDGELDVVTSDGTSLAVYVQSG